MGKIKGWTKVRDDSKMLEYKDDVSGRFNLFAIKGNNDWLVNLNLRVLASMGNRENAKKYMIKYMKTHPIG